MRRPRKLYRTEYLLDGVWLPARYYTRRRNASNWVKRAVRNGWEARFETVLDS